jgi:hypothetical protein
MQTCFKMDQLSIRVLQVYGQECKPRKWIRLFEGVTSIIFYASLSDYDKRVVRRNKGVRLFPLLVINRDQLVVDAARRIPCYFWSSRQLGLVLADVDHTISN